MRDATLESIAVGFFDGVHLGHCKILDSAQAALTFRNHPLAVVAPDRMPRLIMTCEQRIAAIRACGVKCVELLDFTPELAAMPPEDFAERYFKGRLVRCGANWRFGQGGVGDATWLNTHGYAAEVVSYAEYEGRTVSSSRIREALESGRVDAACAMLGHPFVLRGVTFAGKGLGRTLGAPTVNCNLPDLKVNLPLGVYLVEVAGLRGLANYGVAPTMGEQAWPHPVLEIHFLTPPPLPCAPEFDIAFLRYLRPEQHFTSREELQQQIAIDLNEATITGLRVAANAKK